jgi:GMP reductase
MRNEVRKAYHYSDVSLIPEKGILKSRSAANTQVKLGNHEFMIPVLPSNMKCTIDAVLANTLAHKKCFYIMHRFDNNLAFVQQAVSNAHYISVSVGVKADDRCFIDLLKTSNIKPEYITIDIAHGHSTQAVEMIKYIKDVLPDTFLIAGNIATPDAAYDLKIAGANAVKVGIGQGNACTTKDKTGFTMPMFTCVKAVADANIGLPIIADGGIKNNGDIAKAIVAGADLVMCGSLFAECGDSPSDTFVDSQGQVYKLYYGSASTHNKTEHKHIEGTLKHIPQNTMTYLEKLEEIRQDLSSAISYSGGSRLSDLRKVSYYVTR